jgi:hypothetical protein
MNVLPLSNALKEILNGSCVGRECEMGAKLVKKQKIDKQGIET